jgi:hypothetical protein
MDIENTENENIVNELTKKRDEQKRAIFHFYSEIIRLKKGEPRKFQFPITMETCMETINQCYDYITTLETLYAFQPENINEYEVELDSANTYLTQIEEYTHVLEVEKKPTELLTGEQALSAIPRDPQDTKGKIQKRNETPVEEVPVVIEAAASPEEPKETGVNQVINGNDVSKEELYQIQDIPGALDGLITDENVIKSSSEAEDAVVVKEEGEKETPVEEGLKEEDESLSIEQPQEEDQINLQVVVGSDKKENESPGEIPEIRNNVPILTDEDIIEDKNNQEENIYDIELIVNDDKNESESEIINELPDDLVERPVKDISRNKTYSFKAKLQRKKIDEKTVSSIRMFPYDENDENLRKEYLESHNNMISAPHVSRVYLLTSGYFVEISAYGNWDTLSLERIMRNRSIDFVDKEIAILNSLYDHIVYFSYTQNKPTFEEWLSTVKYPDYEILFFGLFDANYEGINYFRLTCPYCGNNNIIVGKENKDLVVAIDKHYTQSELVNHITTKEMNKLDTASYLPKWANTTKVRVMTDHSKYLFEYQVPTLLDYLQVLTSARRISLRDNKPLDLSKILDPESDEYYRILLYLYIHTVGLPNPAYGNPEKPKDATSYKYIGLTIKGDIIETINAVDIEDYSMLLSGEHVMDLISKRSVYYFVKDTKCTNENCGKNIKYVNLDPRSIFFSRTTEATRNLLA